MNTPESGHVKDFTRGAPDDGEVEKLSDADSHAISKNGG